MKIMYDRRHVHNNARTMQFVIAIEYTIDYTNKEERRTSLYLPLTTLHLPRCVPLKIALESHFTLLNCFPLSLGTIVTVANVGDSRVILGYQKDISPPGTAPRPKVRVIPPPDSPGTSHEEISVQAAKGVKPSSAPEYYTAGVDVDDVEVDMREWGIITTMPLSTDHKPDDPREAAVIIAAG